MKLKFLHINEVLDIKNSATRRPNKIIKDASHVIAQSPG